jgi:hypothetical protein
MSEIRNIPDYFLTRYEREFAVWAMNWHKIGISELAPIARPGAVLRFGDDPQVGVKAFVLAEGGLADPSPDEEQGAELKTVFILGRKHSRGIDIEPLTELDKKMIRQHVDKMVGAGVPARARLKEPPRPGLPFMPQIGKG